MFLLIRISLPTRFTGFIVFTFHNVSINSRLNKENYPDYYVFTFHNVSINSPSTEIRGVKMEVFTFHNVSINSNLVSERRTVILNLHSTMFLLILFVAEPVMIIQPDLHSTMFLLIPVT